MSARIRVGVVGLLLVAAAVVASADSGPDDPLVVEPTATATPDAAVAASPPADASLAVVQPAPDNDAASSGSGSPGVYRAASLTLAIISWVGVGVLGYLTYDAKESANERYSSDPAFEQKSDRYNVLAGVTLGSAVLGVIATGVYVYFATRPETPPPKSRHIDVGVGGDGSIGISYSGTFGGEALP